MSQNRNLQFVVISTPNLVTNFHETFIKCIVYDKNVLQRPKHRRKNILWKPWFLSFIFECEPRDSIRDNFIQGRSGIGVIC